MLPLESVPFSHSAEAILELRSKLRGLVCPKKVP